MKRSIYLLTLCGLLILASCKSEPIAPIITDISTDIERVEPPNWWVGFKNSELQLLVKHPNIGSATASIDYPGVTIKKQYTAKSPNYLFLDLEIDKSALSGNFNIIFTTQEGTELKHTYWLYDKTKPSEEFVGFNSSDVIYLITPDRFANGNPDNDINDSLNEKAINRKDNYARHGGDIEGITSKLDYIADMGFTAIWSSPLLTNDMPAQSYHGYAMTNFYEVDPRFGTFEEYKKLADEGRKRGIKLIMDQVANHCGLEHWWMKDLPFSDWVNDQENYEKNIDNWNWKTTNTSNHKRTSNQDNYAADIDKKWMADGWFVSGMPDLNQRNPFMAKYITQNSIWWIEALGLGGIRQDTYPYPDKDFMSDWAGAIMNEYPNFNIVGEEWSYNPLLIAYWQDGNNNKDGYDSNLRSSMDFAMQQTVIDALNEEETWGTGLVKMYEGLANDFIYPTPKDIMVFPDNHDMSRVYTQLKGDVAKTKMALAYYLMMPRTPQIYYGTEILMNDFEKPGDHGLVRTDFPGGWAGDAVNAFTGEGLTDEQKGMQSFLKTVLNYRKTSKAMHEGETKHFAPRGGIYALFRVHGDEVVGIVINKTDTTEIETSILEEMNLNGKTLKDIVTGETMTWGEKLPIHANNVTLFTTKLK